MKGRANIWIQTAKELQRKLDAQPACRVEDITTSEAVEVVLLTDTLLGKGYDLSDIKWLLGARGLQFTAGGLRSLVQAIASVREKIEAGARIGGEASGWRARRAQARRAGDARLGRRRNSGGSSTGSRGSGSR